MEETIFDLVRIKNKNIKKVTNKLCISEKNIINAYTVSNFNIKSVNKKNKISLLIDNFLLSLELDEYSNKKNYYTNKANKKIKYVFKKIQKIKKLCLKNNITIEKIIVNENNNFYMINQLDFLLTILDYDDFKQQYEYIYDRVCDDLDKEFIENNICDFKKNKCISRRNLECKGCSNPLIYGCCYTKSKVCEHLINYRCNIKCLPCKLFTCRFLVKNNIKYKPNDILALRLFFNRRQKNILYNKLFTDKNEIIRLLLKSK